MDLNIESNVIAMYKLPQYRAEVVSFSTQTGWGFVFNEKIYNEHIFVHKNNMDTESGPQTLYKGDIVAFNIANRDGEPKRKKAEGITLIARRGDRLVGQVVRDGLIWCEAVAYYIDYARIVDQLDPNIEFMPGTFVQFLIYFKQKEGVFLATQIAYASENIDSPYIAGHSPANVVRSSLKAPPQIPDMSEPLGTYRGTVISLYRTTGLLKDHKTLNIHEFSLSEVWSSSSQSNLAVGCFVAYDAPQNKSHIRYVVNLGDPLTEFTGTLDVFNPHRHYAYINCPAYFRNEVCHTFGPPQLPKPLTLQEIAELNDEGENAVSGSRVFLSSSDSSLNVKRDSRSFIPMIILYSLELDSTSCSWDELQYGEELSFRLEWDATVGDVLAKNIKPTSQSRDRTKSQLFIPELCGELSSLGQYQGINYGIICGPQPTDGQTQVKKYLFSLMSSSEPSGTISSVGKTPELLGIDSNASGGISANPNATEAMLTASLVACFRRKRPLCGEESRSAAEKATSMMPAIDKTRPITPREASCRISLGEGFLLGYTPDTEPLSKELEPIAEYIKSKENVDKFYPTKYVKFLGPPLSTFDGTVRSSDNILGTGLLEAPALYSREVIFSTADVVCPTGVTPICDIQPGSKVLFSTIFDPTSSLFQAKSVLLVRPPGGWPRLVPCGIQKDDPVEEPAKILRNRATRLRRRRSQALPTDCNQQVSTNGNQQVSTNGNQQVSTNGNQQVSTNGNQQVSTNGNQQVSTNGNQQVSTNWNKQTPADVQVETKVKKMTRPLQENKTNTEKKEQKNVPEQQQTQLPDTSLERELDMFPLGSGLTINTDSSQLNLYPSYQNEPWEWINALVSCGPLNSSDSLVTGGLTPLTSRSTQSSNIGGIYNWNDSRSRLDFGPSRYNEYSKPIHSPLLPSLSTASNMSTQHTGSTNGTVPWVTGLTDSLLTARKHGLLFSRYPMQSTNTTLLGSRSRELVLDNHLPSVRGITLTDDWAEMVEASGANSNAKNISKDKKQGKQNDINISRSDEQSKTVAPALKSAIAQFTNGRPLSSEGQQWLDNWRNNQSTRVSQLNSYSTRTWNPKSEFLNWNQLCQDDIQHNDGINRYQNAYMEQYPDQQHCYQGPDQYSMPHNGYYNLGNKDEKSVPSQSNGKQKWLRYPDPRSGEAGWNMSQRCWNRGNYNDTSGWEALHGGEFIGEAQWRDSMHGGSRHNLPIQNRYIDRSTNENCKQEDQYSFMPNYHRSHDNISGWGVVNNGNQGFDHCRHSGMIPDSLHNNPRSCYLWGDSNDMSIGMSTEIDNVSLLGSNSYKLTNKFPYDSHDMILKSYQHSSMGSDYINSDVNSSQSISNTQVSCGSKMNMHPYLDNKLPDFKDFAPLVSDSLTNTGLLSSNSQMSQNSLHWDNASVSWNRKISGQTTPRSAQNHYSHISLGDCELPYSKRNSIDLPFRSPQECTGSHSYADTPSFLNLPEKPKVLPRKSDSNQPFERKPFARIPLNRNLDSNDIRNSLNSFKTTYSNYTNDNRNNYIGSLETTSDKMFQKSKNMNKSMVKDTLTSVPKQFSLKDLTNDCIPVMQENTHDFEKLNGLQGKSRTNILEAKVNLSQAFKSKIKNNDKPKICNLQKQNCQMVDSFSHKIEKEKTSLQQSQQSALLAFKTFMKQTAGKQNINTEKKSINKNLNEGDSQKMRLSMINSNQGISLNKNSVNSGIEKTQWQSWLANESDSVQFGEKDQRIASHALLSALVEEPVNFENNPSVKGIEGLSSSSSLNNIDIGRLNDSYKNQCQSVYNYDLR